MNAGPPIDARHRRRLAAAACLALMLMAAVVLASAWLRLASVRPACSDWPACRSAAPATLRSLAQRSPDRAADSPALSAARSVHRVAASLLLPIVFALAWLAHRAGARRLAARALAMAALALGLAALGIVTPGARSSAVLLGNLIGGLLLWALAWTAWRGLQPGAALPRRRARLALAGAALWLVQGATGAVSGAAPALRPGDAASLLHLALALPALLWALAVGLAAQRDGRRAEGRALVLAALLQPLLGLAAAGLGAPPALVWAHHALGALGLALLAGLAGAGEASPAPSA